MQIIILHYSISIISNSNQYSIHTKAIEIVKQEGMTDEQLKWQVMNQSHTLE